MLEEINFQNFGVTGRIEHQMDVFVKIKIAEKLYSELHSSKPVTGIFLGSIEGEQIFIKKVFFFNIFDIEGDQISFNREDTISLIDHFKAIYDLSVVGWFINRDLQDEVPTIHLKINEFKDSHFILISGKLNEQKDDVDFIVYSSLANKYFNTCFGAFGVVGLRITNTYKKESFMGDILLSRSLEDKEQLQKSIQQMLCDTSHPLTSYQIQNKLMWLKCNQNRFTEQYKQKAKEDFEVQKQKQIDLLEALKVEAQSLYELTNN